MDTAGRSCIPREATPETTPQRCATSCLTVGPRPGWGLLWTSGDHHTQVGNICDVMSGCLQGAPLNVKQRFSIFCPAAASLSVSGLYGYWPDRRASQFSESQRQTASVRATYHPPPCAEDRPSELESRLELLQSQLNRLV